MAQDGNLRRLFRDNLRDGDWVSIETGGSAAGVPDSNYCFPGGIEGWVEWKRTHGWVVKLRPAQIGWLMRRSRRGGRCFVAVRRLCKQDDDLYLVLGAHAVDLADRGLRETPNLGKWTGGPLHWDWEAVRRALGNNP